MLHEALRHVGHRQTRNRGTIGGSLCHLDPSAELVNICMLLDATLHAQSSDGTREIPMSDFAAGYMTTALEPHELLSEITLPLPSSRDGSAFVEFARRHGDFAIAGATVAVALDDNGRVQRCGIGLLGLGSTPLRGSAAENAVIGEQAEAVTAEDVGRLAIAGLSEIPADLQGSAQYRSRVGTAMVARAWAAAVRQAEMSETEAIHA